MFFSRLLNPYHLFRIILFCLVSKASYNITFGLTTNETDQHALLSVKNLITGDPFNSLGSWNNSLHFCQWKGITCSSRRQRVTKLHLGSLKLVGSLSPLIGNLTFLKSINLENNSFHGAIPQEIGRLFRLQNLSLQENSFQGEIPTNITHCSDIRILDFTENNLGGKIPSQLASFTHLLELLLENNNFLGLIPSSIGNLSSLRTLNLGTNNLVGNIPSKLSRLSNLEFLQLGSNNLSGTVPLSLYNISTIDSIGLVGNQLQGNLPPDLGLTLPNLRGFYIGGNKFSGPFPLSIANASKLFGFDISENRITGPLPRSMGTLGNLEWLNLLANQLGTNHPDDYDVLIKSLANCTNLSFLRLSENGFRGEFPKSVVNLSTTLTELALDSNYIFGSIPQEIGNLENLNILALGGMMLNGSIPNSIGKLSNLEGLYIDTNNISGEIPASIGNISRLNVLALESNMLEGSIPVTFGNITSLQQLDLHRNRLTGVIPGQIFGVSSSFVIIFLNENQLTGALPSEMGSMKSLGQLDVSGNKLTGEIPDTLGNCLMLDILNMQDNRFEGTIPSSFKQLKSIGVLDVSRNNLSGNIPSFLGELRLLQNLNLSRNIFEGEVPKGGVFRNISAFSVMGNLQLCGGIQALRLPACPNNSLKKEKEHFSHRTIYLLVVLLVVLLLAFLAVILVRLVRRSKQQNSSASVLQDQYPKLSYGDLLRATNGFSSGNLIGEGRYGSVYKGILNCSEQIVAVKVLNVELRGANKSFLAECEALRNIRHRNLIKIITSCSSIDFKGSDFKALVLEYMPKGCLDSWLHPSPLEHPHDKNLTLLQRLTIAIDVASAVDYLHNQCPTRIIHCDLKPSNILLNDELCARLGDFGLARFLLATRSEISHAHASSIGIRGTIGYVPPEYGMGEEVSTKGDLYSYGILVLEMFTGKRPTNTVLEDNVSFHNYVRKALPHEVMEIVDPRIKMEIEDDSTKAQSKSARENMEVCLASILQVGVACSAEVPRERMDIKYVLVELHEARDLFLGVGRGRESEYF